MANIPRHIVDQVRERTDISEVIGRHVRLERRGNSFVGLCPFHQEKSPSFNVVPQKGMYYCFGCQAGGDCFKFLMQVEGLSFVEAVKELGKAAGIDVPDRELTPEERRSLQDRDRLYDVLEAAAAFYEQVLWTRPEGEAGRNYLDKRNLDLELARKARVGFAPAGWRNLRDHLTNRGFEPKLLLEAGLLKAKGTDESAAYDVFRERVLFPIRDERSRVIAFGGRLLQGDGPKYLNTPETRLYEKSKVFYGFEMARTAIQQKNRMIIAEGYFDVLAMHEAGFAETVATCGTALTPHHLKKIRRVTKNIVFLQDSDAAGTRAAEKVVDVFMDVFTRSEDGAETHGESQKIDITPWRLQLPGAKDPDDLLRSEGPEAVARAVENAKEPLFDWYIDRTLRASHGDPIAVDAEVKRLLPLLAILPVQYVEDVARRSQIPFQELMGRVRAATRVAGPRPIDNTPPPPSPAEMPRWKPNKEVTHILWLLVHRYERVADLIHTADPQMFNAHEPIKPILARLASGEPIAAILGDAIEPDVRRTLQAIVARTELYAEEHAAQGMAEVLDRLLQPIRDTRLTTLVQAIEQAFRDGDTAAARAAGKEREILLKLKTSVPKALRDGDVQLWAKLVRDAAAEISNVRPS